MKLIQLVFLLPCLGWGCQNRASDESVAPVSTTNGRYLFQLEHQQLAVDPAIGGRITSLTLNGEEFLTGPEVNDFNWGSTFWPSPQRVWNWPPSAELDNQPYDVMSTNETLKMRSQRDPQTGLMVTKEFAAAKQPERFILRYTLTNDAEATQSVAPWEVTRVKTEGLTFFPKGDGAMRGGLLPLTTLTENGVAWFDYDAAGLPVTGNRQLYTDGASGWMAHIDGRMILIKKFQDIPLSENAPEEGEIELFASDVKPGKSYVEIEHQGAYTELAPGDSLTWEVVWYLRRLPDSLEVAPGNNLLVDYAKSVIK